MIKQTDIISIKPLREASDAESNTSELFIGNRPVNQTFLGNWLISAFQCDAGYLVFLSEDYLYTETLNIYLLNFAGTILDSAIFFDSNPCDFQIQQPDAIIFELHENVFFKITVLSKPTFRLPIISDPLINFKRPFRFKRHIFIKKIHTQQY